MNDRRLHFGLGTVTSVDLEIRWPTGAVERLGNTGVDKLVEITEGSGITRIQQFSTPK